MVKPAHTKKLNTKDLKAKTHKLYKKLGSVWCGAVKDNVVFNNHGWIHLSFSRGGRRRSTGLLRLRLHLFKYVPRVVKTSKVVIKETSGTILSRRGIARVAKYFEIAQVCGKEKHHVTVILRKIEGGKLHYYSVRRTSIKTKKALTKSGLV